MGSKGGNKKAVDNLEKISYSTAKFCDMNDMGDDLIATKQQNKVENVPSTCSLRTHVTGFRHKLTGTIYRNKASQTRPPAWKYGLVERFNRESQTITVCDQVQQTPVDACTQVSVRNIFIQTTGDKILYARRNYKNSNVIEEEYLKRVVMVQNYVRCWLARRELERRKKIDSLKQLWEKKQERLKSNKENNWWKELEKRKLNPVDDEDFALLFKEVQKWWNSEAEDISKTRTGADLKAAMLMLLDAETKKIEEINRKKILAKNTKYSEIKQKLLTIVAKPKIWRTYNSAVQVETDATQRGKVLHNLHLSLSMKCISAQDRISALLSLVELIKPYKSKLTSTLTQLANREVDLLLRGTKEEFLGGLRTRIQDLFWQYAKQPIINPEMQRFLKVKETDGKPPNILCCAACKQFYVLPLNATDDLLGKSVLQNCFAKCKKCLYLENEGWIRKDFKLYQRILTFLIDAEEEKGSASPIIYILQTHDIGHLVEKIWRRQSCLSGYADESQLQLVRYNSGKKWTPWNCMLVTNQEALIIDKIPFSKTNYDQSFKTNIAQRHAAARSYFASIPRFLPFIFKSEFDTKQSLNI
ncbi:IQ and ubiquitin-like domain-containing protein [Uloborus diversus]|uniref:IQ and ubiquitin-like domain-containing protein n=1 Tax=Uloborus diversus TaxID=327109 RepID=UPI0024090939|nr:IQ and ubiquitin-like domain-containing protein [Uloborus diversus]